MIRPMMIAICASMAGCVPTAVDVPLDLDEDGLLSDGEAAAGTDPEKPDSDGDDHLDGAEVAEGTDPLDADSHPYKGGWKIDAHCRDSIEPTGGTAVGDIASDFELMDQHGERVRLYDFCGRAILLISGAFW